MRLALPLAFVSLVPAASGQAVLRSWYDPNALLSTYGLETLGDVDGDGKADVAIKRLIFTTTFLEVLDVCSSASGAQLIRIDRGVSQIRASGSAGDVDGDGRDDVVIGSVNGAEVVSSATGALLASQAGHVGTDFGLNVVGLGDVDGDAVPDFASAGARLTLGGYADGYILVCSGADGSVLRTIAKLGGGTNLGASLARMPDFDGDGVDDIAAGDPLGHSDFSGFVKIFSSTTGTSLIRYDGPAGYFGFGSSLAVCRDFNGDGISDLVVLGGRVASTLPSYEVAFTLSGADGALLGTFESPPKKRWKDVASAGDANGDGAGDFALASDQDLGSKSIGSVWLFDGRTQLPLYTYEQFDYLSGFFVTGVPDVDGDGRDELLMGPDTTQAAVLHAGNDLFLDAIPVVALAGETFGKTLRTGIPGNLGLIALIGVNGAPFFLPILGPTTFDASGTIGYQVTVPPGLAGLTLDYLGFAIDVRGKVAASAVETVVFE